MEDIRQKQGIAAAVFAGLPDISTLSRTCITRHLHTKHINTETAARQYEVNPVVRYGCCTEWRLMGQFRTTVLWHRLRPGDSV